MEKKDINKKERDGCFPYFLVLCLMFLGIVFFLGSVKPPEVRQGQGETNAKIAILEKNMAIVQANLVALTERDKSQKENVAMVMKKFESWKILWMKNAPGTDRVEMILYERAPGSAVRRGFEESNILVVFFLDGTHREIYVPRGPIGE